MKERKDNQPLTQAMNKAGLNEKKLAEMLGVSASTVNNWKHGSPATPRLLERIEKVLGATAVSGFKPVTRNRAKPNQTNAFVELSPVVKEGYDAQVVCIDNKNTAGRQTTVPLTIGKTYTVVALTVPGCIGVVDDTGETTHYAQARFIPKDGNDSTDDLLMFFRGFLTQRHTEPNLRKLKEIERKLHTLQAIEMLLKGLE